MLPNWEDSITKVDNTIKCKRFEKKDVSREQAAPVGFWLVSHALLPEFASGMDVASVRTVVYDEAQVMKGRVDRESDLRPNAQERLSCFSKCLGSFNFSEI